MIAIIDYDAGNIKSVEKAIQSLGEEVVITRNKEELLAADKVILPGVGAFGDAMKKLKEYDHKASIFLPSRAPYFLSPERGVFLDENCTRI